MNAAKIKQAPVKPDEKKGLTEPPWNVILYNDRQNSMPRVVSILIKAIPRVTTKKGSCTKLTLMTRRWSNSATTSLRSSMRSTC